MWAIRMKGYPGSHIMKVSVKISRAIFFINRLQNILPEGSLKSLYYSLVHSHPHYESHTQNVFKDCNILKMKDIFKYQVALMVHDWFNH